MKEEKIANSRRKLLKSIAAGGGAVVAGKSLPESWSHPVVDSVILPAHAETSAPPVVPLILSGSSEDNFAQFTGDENTHYASDEAGVLDRVVSKLVPDAKAGGSASCKADGWTCYAEKTGAPLDEPDGEWILVVKQSKYKDGCSCPTKERIWEAMVTYDSNKEPNGKSDRVNVDTIDSCGMSDPDKDGQLEFVLKNVPDKPQIKIAYLGKKYIDLNVFLHEGGVRPMPECCPPLPE
jgi:hypothetical protein